MMPSVAQISPEACIPYIDFCKEEFRERFRGSQYDTWCSFMEYYGGQVLNIAQYKEPEYERRILRALDKTHSDNESRGSFAYSIGKSGIRSEGVIPALIKMMKSQEEIAWGPLMAFRDAFIVRPAIVSEAIKLLQSQYIDTRIRAINYLAQIQYVTTTLYNGKQTELAYMVEDLFYKYKDEKYRSFSGYAIEYMGKVNHKNPKLEETVLQAAISIRNEVFTDIETLIRYLVNVNHFSPRFIGLLMSYQRITGKLDSSCYVANSYFENIERHVPETKQKFVKTVLMEFWYKNIIRAWKLRKELINANSDDMWAHQQEERVYRLGLALQKIVLCEDEKNQRIFLRKKKNQN
jgi:hypothetical protein